MCTVFFFLFSLFLIYSDQILRRGNNAGPIIPDSAPHGLVVVLKNNAAGSRSICHHTVAANNIF